MRIKDKLFSKGGTSVAVILIIVLTSVVYANSLKNSFVLDDNFIIVDNDFIKSWKNFPAIFSKAYLPSGSKQDFYKMRNLGSSELTYRPAVTATYFIDYSLWRLNPFGYHLTNLILHIANVVLLYFFIGLIAKDKRIALLTSFFFGVHPINSEAVNAIAFREDLLAFFFFISSFILFIKSDYYKGRRRFFSYILSTLLFLPALFSKEMAITLPVLLILYDYYFLFQKEPKKILANLKSRYIGYITVSLFYLWVYFFLIGNINQFWARELASNFYINLITLPKAILVYIKWFFMPINVHFTLQDPAFFSYSFFEAEVLISVSVIIICLMLVLMLYKRAKELSFGMLWFFVALVPVFNIVPVTDIVTVASRYLYIPAVGLCLILAALLHNLPTLKISFFPHHILQRVARNTIVVLLVFYSTFTIIRNLAWRNNITLWSEAVEYYPNDALSHLRLGSCLKTSGLLDKAVTEYKTAITLDPYYFETYSQLGYCYYKKGMLGEAISEFKKALELNPGWPDAYVNIGVIFGVKKQYQEAIGYFKQAIKVDPICIDAYNNLGTTYALMGDYARARQAWEKALEIDPEFKDAQDNLKKLEGLGF